MTTEYVIVKCRKCSCETRIPFTLPYDICAGCGSGQVDEVKKK
jgi:hypothetical protein